MKINIENSLALVDLFPLMIHLEPEGTTSFAHFFSWLSSHQRTGVIMVDLPAQPIELMMIDGKIYDVKTKNSDENSEYAELLWDKDLLSFKQVESAQKIARQQNKPLLMVLFAKKQLSASDIVAVIRKRIQGKLDIMFEKQEFRMEYIEKNVSKTPVFVDPLDYMFYFYKKKLKQYVLKDFKPILEPFMYKFPLVLEVKDTLLSQNEIDYIMTYYSGKFTINKLLEKSTLSSHDSARLTFLHLSLGLIDIGVTSLKTLQNDEIIEKIDSKFLDVEKKEHFAILGVHWTSYINEIEMAHNKIKKEYSKYINDKTIPEKVINKAKSILEAVENSYLFLSNRTNRQEYRTELYDPQKLIFAADFLYKQAILYKFKNNYRQAEQYFLASLDIKEDPKCRKTLNDMRNNLVNAAKIKK